MEQYRKEQKKQSILSRMAGSILALSVLFLFYDFLYNNGFTYMDPPRPDQSPITIDFIERVEKEIPPKQETKGTKPTAEKPIPTKPIELVKRAEAPVKGTKQNVAQATQVDEVGDVETVTPAPKEINKKALFKSAPNFDNKDVLEPQTSSQTSNNLETGHSQGNVKEGKQKGTANAQLAGRSVIGVLPKPNYDITEPGTVVVRIKVDRNGNVISAKAGYDGTNLTSKAAWDAAEEAALRTHFNVSENAPEYQYGTIKYIFSIVR
jgi:hypothetical protein